MHTSEWISKCAIAGQVSVQFGCTLVENKSKPDVTTKLELPLHILRINLEMALDILRRIQEMPLQNLTTAHKWPERKALQGEGSVVKFGSVLFV